MNDLKRHDDYPDIPRPLAWLLITVKEVGITAVVIGALLYICFFQLNHINDSYHTDSSNVVIAIDKNTEAITALRHFLTHKYDQ